jgi:hypothetical protein
MRILNEDDDKKIDRTTIYLTVSEAEELQRDLARIIRSPKRNHAHISSSDCSKEVTICVYDESAIEEYGFNDRSKRLIKDDV